MNRLGKVSRDKILDYLKTKQQVRVEDIRREFDLSRVLIHRQLKKLIENGLVSKTGKPPLVFYSLSEGVSSKHKKEVNIPDEIRSFIDKRYLYVSPTGEILNGFVGFEAWVRKTGQMKNLLSLAKKYVKVRKDADINFTPLGLIEASDKFNETFENNLLNKVYYVDFYALPKFGKTKLGQMVLYAKQTQKVSLIKDVARNVYSLIKRLIVSHKIEVVAFIPPSVPRQVQFLKEFERTLNLDLFEINLVKAYAGEILIPQKTLSKLEERIQNAKETIFIKDRERKYQTVLLIDDAIGSGSTLNETAKKILSHYPSVKKVIGFAVVGSFKGFDVIREI